MFCFGTDIAGVATVFKNFHPGWDGGPKPPAGRMSSYIHHASLKKWEPESRGTPENVPIQSSQHLHAKGLNNFWAYIKIDQKSTWLNSDHGLNWMLFPLSQLYQLNWRMALIDWTLSRFIYIGVESTLTHLLMNWGQVWKSKYVIL